MTALWEDRHSELTFGRFYGQRWLDKCHRLNSGYVESFAAADVLASDHVVASHHVALRLGKACAVAVVRSTGKLTLFPAHDPAQLVFRLLSAVRAGHCMGSLLWTFIEIIPFFHAV